MKLVIHERSSRVLPQIVARSGVIRPRLSTQFGANVAISVHRQGLPLFESLKKDWARGKVTSAKVLEHAQGAIQQGAQFIDNFADIGGHIDLGISAWIGTKMETVMDSMAARRLVEGIFTSLPTHARAVKDEEGTYSVLSERVHHLNFFDQNQATE